MLGYTHTAMKKLFKLPVFMLGLILLLAGTALKVQAQDDDISLQTFYDELSPYGTWIQDSQYGYVWRPDVDQQDFRPYYSDGRWVMTEYGNTWVSDYEWGWAPFHYGRWVNNRYNDWVWIPDTTWGPAWVSWRSGGGYYGWAPLGPGINININLGGGYRIPNSWWVFVPQRNIYYDRFPSYRSYRNVTIINNTTIINYTGQRNRNTYFTGPRRDDIRRATNRDVNIYQLNRTDRSGRSTISNNTVNIYNPRSNRNTDNRNAAPRKVSSENEYATSRNNRTNSSSNNQSRSTRGDVSAPANQTGRVSERNSNTQRNNVEGNGATGATSGRTTRQDGSTVNPTQRSEAQRTQREHSQAQQRQDQGRQQQAEGQRQERVQSQQRQEQAQQRQEQGRQQQAQAQQQERAQSQQRQAQAQQQQQQQQQRSQNESRQQQQPQRQERVQQSAPSRSNESRGNSQPQSSRSSRDGRG